jgi:uncharacterized protein
LKVKVDELPDSGRVIHFHESGEWFASRVGSDQEADGVSLAGPINVEMEIIPVRDQIRVQGHLETTATLQCSRCLDDFTVELNDTFDLVLLRPLLADAPEEIDLRPQDLNTEFYDGVSIDVDFIIAEQIFLALPQKPLCQPHCPGLCPTCGVELKHESCECEKQATGSAFDALRSIKLDRK